MKTRVKFHDSCFLAFSFLIGYFVVNIILTLIFRGAYFQNSTILFITSPFNWQEDFTNLYSNPVIGMLENSLFPFVAISLPSIYNTIIDKLNRQLPELEQGKNLIHLENIQSSFKVLIYSIVSTYLVSGCNYFITGTIGSGTSIIAFCLLIYFGLLFSYKTKVNYTKFTVRISLINLLFVIVSLGLGSTVYVIGLLFTKYYSSIFYHLEGLFFFTLITIFAYGFRRIFISP